MWRTHSEKFIGPLLIPRPLLIRRRTLIPGPTLFPGPTSFLLPIVYCLSIVFRLPMPYDWLPIDWLLTLPPLCTGPSSEAMGNRHKLGLPWNKVGPGNKERPENKVGRDIIVSLTKQHHVRIHGATFSKSDVKSRYESFPNSTNVLDLRQTLETTFFKVFLWNSVFELCTNFRKNRFQ